MPLAFSSNDTKAPPLTQEEFVAVAPCTSIVTVDPKNKFYCFITIFSYLCMQKKVKMARDSYYKRYAEYNKETEQLITSEVPKDERAAFDKEYFSERLMFLGYDLDLIRNKLREQSRIVHDRDKYFGTEKLKTEWFNNFIAEDLKDLKDEKGKQITRGCYIANFRTLFTKFTEDKGASQTLYLKCLELFCRSAEVIGRSFITFGKDKRETEKKTPSVQIEETMDMLIDNRKELRDLCWKIKERKNGMKQVLQTPFLKKMFEYLESISESLSRMTERDILTSVQNKVMQVAIELKLLEEKTLPVTLSTSPGGASAATG